jgi:prefoldin subunit 5
MHFWNIPTASDVARLRRQVDTLQRQLHAVNKTLQEVRNAGELKRHA